ncbi:MAG TPA: nuclear transport factor 2 family protein [Anaeromyxobacteraceae bacterium]|nr:nuclear transport factor 2 family protein [Anaeromyxobacteraceae bacterium]
MPRQELDVLEANSAFYRAFAACDLAAMDALWAREVPVACVHPGWDALRGREEVMSSWRAIFSGDPPRIASTAASAHVAGDAAFVVCHERIPGGPRLVATNVFVREGGAWRLCHHQAGPLNQEPGEAPPEAEA